jgi:hypothetical protein
MSNILLCIVFLLFMYLIFPSVFALLVTGEWDIAVRVLKDNPFVWLILREKDSDGSGRNKGLR